MRANLEIGIGQSHSQVCNMTSLCGCPFLIFIEPVIPDNFKWWITKVWGLVGMRRSDWFLSVLWSLGWLLSGKSPKSKVSWTWEDPTDVWVSRGVQVGFFLEGCQLSYTTYWSVELWFFNHNFLQTNPDWSLLNTTCHLLSTHPSKNIIQFRIVCSYSI